MIQRKLFYINSRNRLSGTDSNFSYALDLTDFDPDSCVVLQANIPKSFYVVQDGFNTFRLNEEGVDTITSIPVGNYSRNSFRTTLQTILNTTSPNGYSYTVTNPSASSTADTGKFAFSCVGHSAEPSFIFDDVNNVYELMGFEPGSTNPFVNGSLVSTNVIKLSKEDTIFIKSSLVGGVHSSGILQEIYSVEQNDFSNIVWHNFNVELYTKHISDSNSNAYNFSLHSENNVPLNLNGLNWSMTLCMYKNLKERSNNLLRSYMKYSLANN